MTKIIALINKRNAGDDAAAISTAKETQNQCGGTVEEINISEPGCFENLSLDDNSIVIGSGSHMLDALRDLKQKNSKIITCFASHQVPQHFISNLIDLDLVAFPKHVLTEENEAVFGNKLVKTIGVAHNLTAEDLQQEFAKRQNAIPLKSKYLFVILGGDAQLQGTQYQYYSAEEAAETARYVADKVKNEEYFLLITNGPRTGMLNPLDGSKLETHRILPNQEYKVDPVSQAFLDELSTQKISADCFKFYDFKFLEKGVDSAYKALLYSTIITPESLVLVPGESTSMISECCDMLPYESILVVQNKAMNDNHHSHVSSVIESGYARSLNIESAEISENLTTTSQTRKSAAATIADGIKQLVYQKLTPSKLLNPNSAQQLQTELNQHTV